VGVEVKVENLTKRFGKQTIFEDVSLTIPKGEISVMLGPSGTGKSVFLKHLVGLLKPNAGHIWIKNKDVCTISEHELYETRKLFGVLFQDGALFGSQNLFDNIAFPLREHTKKGEAEIKKIVLEKMNLVGLSGAERKLPGEISGGMRKRAGLARALVLDPEILLFDEPDSGLDPVRTSYLDQLIIDLNAQTGATCLIVTHNINTARTVPDNIGLLYRRRLAMFGPRPELLTSDEPVVLQFMNGRKQGPIGMSEEKDAAELAAEAEEGGSAAELPPIEPQLLPSWPLVRPSMASPHGSHAFLRDKSRRQDVPFGSVFGESGIEPSDEPPAHPMSVEEFREQSKKGQADATSGSSSQGSPDRGERRDDADRKPRPRPSGSPSPSFEQQSDGRRPSPSAGAQTVQMDRPSPAPTPSSDGASPSAPAPQPAPVATAQPYPSSSRPRPTPTPDGTTGPNVTRTDRPRPTPFPGPPPSSQKPSTNGSEKRGRKGVLAGWRGRRGDRE
jgi:phospholipid/cholesterol/gamma-HCH transport system ATP-binding protein